MRSIPLPNKNFIFNYGEKRPYVFFVYEKRERKRVLRPRVCATARTPKTPVFGLPKSRPSPLQKTPFFALSEAKSVHF
jgi:hypothetical protein